MNELKRPPANATDDEWVAYYRMCFEAYTPEKRETTRKLIESRIGFGEGAYRTSTDRQWRAIQQLIPNSPLDTARAVG